MFAESRKEGMRRTRPGLKESEESKHVQEMKDKGYKYFIRLDDNGGDRYEYFKTEEEFSGAEYPGDRIIRSGIIDDVIDESRKTEGKSGTTVSLFQMEFPSGDKGERLFSGSMTALNDFAKSKGFEWIAEPSWIFGGYWRDGEVCYLIDIGEDDE